MFNDHVFRWVLDVAPLWPSSGTHDKRELTKEHWANVPTSQTALNLLSFPERDKVLRFYFVNDAKLCLGSCLLKRKAVFETCGVSWSLIVIGQDENKKPCYKPEDPSGATLEFNVSHHGSLVALVGCSGPGLQLGVDIVKIDYEKDFSMVMERGFSDWARTYESVFSDREMDEISHFMDGVAEPQSWETVRAQLRHFYAHWCLKEAYVKMTGEALLAPNLKELEFRNVQVPQTVDELDAGGIYWGQTCGNCEIWLDGKQLMNVSLEIQAYREDYMIATAASSPSINFSRFQELDYERDILPNEE